ncbi:MAG: glycoside hydrolase family 3 protein [Agathobaculum sp.]|jgi:beta-N-acetylhexosaminidase|uniref:glycoside hydrolase family 3 protein n=1 Tax=Agathobaculum sp. TaxID=2048138 RepID=UPI003D919D3A
MKRLLAGLLFAALCLTGLSACGTDGTAEADAPSHENQAPQEPPAPAPAPDPETVLRNAAQAYTDRLSLEQQLAQMFFVRCPETDAAALAEQYPIGGYLLFGRDFEGQTPDTIRETIRSYQEAAATPMLIGVDEEGGTVVRVSSNPNFRAEKFRSPQALYREGGLPLLIEDAAEKDALLSSIGINVNFSPVCDVSTDPNDFIYARTIGQDAAATAACIREQVTQMQADRMGMVLKHFPGYGSNADTHTGIAIDERPLETFRTSDFLPFAAGIESGAQSVLVSHNIVRCMDDALPASLSPAVHEILRGELGFDGVVMTDDLIMEAITDYTGGENAAVLAVQAGNDMLVSSDFVTQYNAVLAAVQDGRLDPARIRESAVRVIRWKMQLGLIETEPAHSTE